MIFLKILIGIVGGLFAFASVAANPFDMPMRFVKIDPCGGGNASFCAPTVLLQGVIEPDSPGKLRDFLKANDVYRVVFDSPGGNLLAGMEIGRIIRQKRLVTILASEIVTWENGSESKVVSKAVCASACAYAFLGGLDRGVEPGGLYGVHQFSGNGKFISENSAQRMSVALAMYVEMMGASRALVDIALLTDPDKMRFLAPEELVRFGVDTGNRPPPEWELHVGDNGDPTATFKKRGENGAVFHLGLASDNASTFSLIVYVQLDPSQYKSAREFVPDKEFRTVKMQIAGRGHLLAQRGPGWVPASRGIGFIGVFAVPSHIVEGLRNTPGFELDFAFPRSMAYEDPGGYYSTRNLDRFIPLLRAQTATIAR